MSIPRTIIIMLIGLRGSGKSTLGRMLADELAVEFIDLDQLVLDRLGAESVAEVWQQSGESAWREMEETICTELLEEDTDSSRVLALGGGAAMIPGVQDAMATARHARRIKVLYLRGNPETLHDRVAAGDPDRPPLTGETDPRTEMKQIFEERDGVYWDIADAMVSIDEHDDIEATLQALLRVVRPR